MARRREQILPFTLTELFALLFFALALALVYQSIKRDEVEQQVLSNREILNAAAMLGPDASRTLAQLLTSGAERFPEDFKELTRQMSSESQVRRTLEAALAEGNFDPARIDSLSTQALIDTLIALKERAENEIDALSAAAGLSESERSVIEQLVAQAQAAENERRDSEREKADLRAQLTYLQRRVGNGLDHPPCWADAAGRPEFAYRVIIQTSTVSIRPEWPPHRRDDAERIDGMLDAIGENLTYATFAERASPVFAWSRRQNPECRHFVVIVDDVDGGKEPFKAGLLTVERFFYKLLAN